MLTDSRDGRSHEARIVGDLKLRNLGAENQTQVLCRSSVCS